MIPSGLSNLRYQTNAQTDMRFISHFCSSVVKGQSISNSKLSNILLFITPRSWLSSIRKPIIMLGRRELWDSRIAIVGVKH